MKSALGLIKRFAYDETGLSTVEVILILVVLVTLVIIFREEMIDIVEDVFKAITDKIKKIT
ncbi:MAG: holin, BlyA family protein [Lachnospiraceae bacterium]|jgi:Flp pilus assembly pilin Flp|nr:holin, BlyA family protein [Lachnospiraceae bacterium]MBQ2184564.1 holin, BlyA family protein [Lachnospiraceae bacterium]SDJ15951.1 Putative Flagellin, Flp1-like, domain [Lachnospiraceae bacterium G41]